VRDFLGGFSFTLYYAGVSSPQSPNNCLKCMVETVSFEENSWVGISLISIIELLKISAF